MLNLRDIINLCVQEGYTLRNGACCEVGLLERSVTDNCEVHCEPLWNEALFDKNSLL